MSSAACTQAVPTTEHTEPAEAGRNPKCRRVSLDVKEPFVGRGLFSCLSVCSVVPLGGLRISRFDRWPRYRLRVLGLIVFTALWLTGCRRPEPSGTGPRIATTTSRPSASRGSIASAAGFEPRRIMVENSA